MARFPLRQVFLILLFLLTSKQAWRTFVVRKQPKDHGMGKLIEGTFEHGEKAVVVDDVLTTGGSLLKATDAARNQGLQVSHAFIIVDRSETDRHDHLTQHGLTLHSLLTLDDLKRTAPSSQ